MAPRLAPADMIVRHIESHTSMNEIGPDASAPTPLTSAPFGLSVEKNIEYSGLILKTLWGLITGATSPRQLMGPVGIAEISGESARVSWVALFAVMASISLNLGLLNLMPIPVLDGGHILIMALETIARRDFKPFEVWEGVPVPPHAATRQLRALGDAAGTAWRTLQPGDRLSFGKVDLVVANTGDSNPANDIVFLGRNEERKALLRRRGRDANEAQQCEQRVSHGS